MKITYIGAFDWVADKNNRATSAAGNQVQAEIIEAFAGLKPMLGEHVQVVALKPIQAWPAGPLRWPGLSIENMTFPAFVNLPVVKRLHFAIGLIRSIFSFGTKIVVSYNPSFWECLVFLLYRKCRPGAFIVSIIQDVHVSSFSKALFRSVADLMAMKLATRFDFVVPISQRIVDDFGFDGSRALVFSGGLTRQGRLLMSSRSPDAKPHAVFAGALEPYNGIDVLVHAWQLIELDMELHIFGKGSCEGIVRQAALDSSRIVYHGFQAEEEVNRWQASALINFCLRFARNIEPGYFFPSKFFNAICAPGAVVVNHFEGIPACLEANLFFVSDDLANLEVVLGDILGDLSLIEAQCERRRVWIRENGDWGRVAEEIITRAVGKLECRPA